MRGRPLSPHLYLVDENGCWVWQRARRNGYGAIGRGGRVHLAHRVFYERHVGAIPDGLQLDHLCRNRACVNPEHLEPVTPAENVRRSRVAKLSLDDARAIRASGDSVAVLADSYGVSARCIQLIRAGHRWQDNTPRKEAA